MNHIVLVTTSFPDGTAGSEAAGSFVSDFARILAEDTLVTVVAAGSRTAEEQPAANLRIQRFAAPPPAVVAAEAA